jgi:hypothetical protein
LLLPTNRLSGKKQETPKQNGAFELPENIEGVEFNQPKCGINKLGNKFELQRRRV